MMPIKEDTRKWANADAKPLAEMTPRVRNPTPAARKEQNDFSKRSFEDALDRVSEQERTPGRA